MSKIAILGDPHFGCRNGDLNILNNQKNFYENVFFPYLLKNKINTIIDMGDTFDKRKNIDIMVLNNVKDFYFDFLQKHDIQLHIIVGNHSTYYKNTNSVNSVTELLHSYRNVHIYEDPQTVMIEDLNICIIPWINSENSEKTFDEIEKSNAVLCCGHLELSGFEFHKGSVNKHGLSPSVFKDKFILTLSGHYHKKSVTKDIVYVGTPYQMTWIEHDENKGFHILDTNDLSLDFIENPFVLFREIMYPETIEDVTNKFIRIVVSEEQSKDLLFQKYIEEINEKNPLNVQVKIIDKIVNSDKEEITEEVETDLLKITKNYIDNLENFNKKEELFEIFNQLYSESSV